MKVLFITNEFSHPSLRETGGIGRFYKELSDELVNNGNQVHVLGANQIKFNCVDNGISFHFYNKINFLTGKLAIISLVVNRFILLVHFISFVRKHKIDIIEINEPITAYMISFFKGSIPMVLRQHGMHSILAVMYGNKVNKVYHFLEKKAHQHADKIISVSRYIKQLILELYGSDLSVDVVYNGIKMDDNELFNTKVNKRTLLYVAALSEKKGYLDLVNVFNAINLKDDSVDLVIIGRESEFAFKSLKFTESALNRIKYIGYLDYDKLKKYYRSSNLFLNFTKGETFGLTTIEAMSFNRPVIVSDIGVSEEIVESGKSGYIVNVENIEDVLTKVFTILDNFSTQKRMGKFGSAFVKTSFTNKIMSQMTIETYKKVLGATK